MKNCFVFLCCGSRSVVAPFEPPQPPAQATRSATQPIVLPLPLGERREAAAREHSTVSADHAEATASELNGIQVTLPDGSSMTFESRTRVQVVVSPRTARTIDDATATSRRDSGTGAPPVLFDRNRNDARDFNTGQPLTNR